ncbi:MAG: hypothetical protein ACRDYX_04210 [Egibacteraceae bacterium]
MAVDERTRHGLYTRLEEVLGGEHAMTLMEHLPPVGWADVATKQDLGVLKGDLAALEQRLGQRIDGLEERIDLKIDGLEERIDLKMEGLEGRIDLKIDGLEERIDHKVDGLEERIDLKMEALKHELRSDFHTELVVQTRLFLLAMTGSSATIASLAFAAARLT